MRPPRAHTIPPVKAPRGDDGYFEALTRCVFQAGLDWGIIKERWPAFRRAFRRFSTKAVADFGPDDVDRLMQDDSGIVRNYRKIAATIRNATALLELKGEFGSFRGYLRSFDKRATAPSLRTSNGASATWETPAPSSSCTPWGKRCPSGRSATPRLPLLTAVRDGLKVEVEKCTLDVS